ncbi:MAG: hypothetical protein Q8L65_09725, partial [Burkholderiales bacterium]|nr:hypothetical protein [Burkholderiales bacterium]
TAEGGAGAADSGTALYAIAAHSNLPGRLIAVTTDTQTTAGTWVALPSLVQAAPFDQDIFFPAAAAFAGPGIKQGYGISNNVSDATNDIDIAAGKAVDSTGAVVMSGGAQTKRLDADWAPGSGNGGRYSGAAITNGTYHVWKIAKAGGADVDSYLDPSADVNTVLGHVQAESGGASYLYAWRIGSIMRESATLVPFVQIYDLFMRKTPILDVSAAGVGTSAVLRTLSVPAGLKVQAEFFAYYRNTSGSPDGCNMYFTDPDLTDLAPNMTLSPGTAPGGDGSTLDTRMGAVNFIYTNTSRQVRSRVGATGGSITLYMVTRGWRDPAIYRS